LCPNTGMVEVKVTAFRFSDEELELLGVIEGHTGIRSRTEALRQVLHDYAEGEEPTMPLDVDVRESTEPKKQP
jgi:hypothetical protein